MADLTLRPLPLPEFHRLRKPHRGGAHVVDPVGMPAARSADFYLESTADAVRAFGTGISPTRFQFYFVGLVRRSRACCTTGLASFGIEPATAFFVPPEQIHSSCDWSTNDQGYALSFSEAFFVETLADKAALRHSPLFQWDRPPFLRLSKKSHVAIEALFDQLAAEWDRKPRPSQTALRLLLQLIVARLEEEASAGHAHHPPADAATRLYHRFRAVLEERFREMKSPAAYAARLGVNPNHFATAVRAVSGLPPGDWIRARIVLEAQCLLGNTTRAVKEVAAELGYDDEAYFSRLFKKAVGVAPRQYQLGGG